MVSEIDVLNDAKIRAARLKAKAYKLTDANRLYLLVKPGGSKLRAAFSTIMNEWVERGGRDHDRKIIDLMLAHVPKERVESAYNRAAYMPRRRELAQIWADMLAAPLADPRCLFDRPAKIAKSHRTRRIIAPVAPEFVFPRHAEKSTDNGHSAQASAT